jgi:ABC-2 type transport system ATP-binding protein
MENMVISTRGLTKRFANLVAVDHVSIEVRKGEIFGLLGPNGAGKTTLIRMLCTLARPSEGSATVAGFDIRSEGSKIREHIGLVSEKMIMYAQLTAKENLRLFGRFYHIPQPELDNRVNQLLELVDMEKWADKQIGRFSTGMKQRINVIRALLNEPDILFLDEPTLGLDPQTCSEIRQFLRQINTTHETTLILTTHIMVEADNLCNRIAIIDHGKVAALDTSENLKRMVSGSEMKVIEIDIRNLTNDLASSIDALNCVKTSSRLNETHIRVQAEGEEVFDEIIDAVRNAGGKINSINRLDPTLEDAFLQITGNEVRDLSVAPGSMERPGLRKTTRARSAFS